MGACRNETCVLCQAKNRHQRCHCSIIKNLTQSANPFLKNQNHAKKMMIEFNWKLFVISLTVINPTLPTFDFTYIAVHYILSCYHGNTVTKGTLQNESS